MPPFGLTDMLIADISLSVHSLYQNSLFISSNSGCSFCLIHPGVISLLWMPHSCQPQALVPPPLSSNTLHFPFYSLKHIYLFRPISIILKFNNQIAVINSSQRTQNNPVTNSVSCSDPKTKQEITFFLGRDTIKTSCSGLPAHFDFMMSCVLGC